MDAQVSERFDLRMRVGDMWVDGAQRSSAPMINPALRSIAHVPEATADDAWSALEAAKCAQPTWAALTPRERATHLRRVAKLVRNDVDRLARIISLEEGKPLREARFEIVECTAGFFEYFADSGRAAHGEVLPSDNRDEEVTIRKVPYGVCVGITPWNFHSAMGGRKVAPASMAGNTTTAAQLMPSSV
jgi:lactaldehyde dehydrogenase/glycolaldehyde dehydrogenase